ncbi:sensor histidine kinase [Gulosibacter molinativorax]|uniref:histidine kinase n=1 Tax=Gulosibacter molinativorax TaxID=256821 RepID=A0ABT7C711_9MICO|nr:histidine kinase [Gulosibacter molinativorax]MDJ1370991.1 hypothetical protein [Gulosibacter molinativorax]QUY62783.1 Hypotetical protein [Gulosibacter molinativorax]
MASPWWRSRWHWVFAVLVGVWAAVFLVPAPTPWAWVVPPIAMLGAWLLGPRPVLGAALILLASLVSALTGVEYGGIDLVLPVMAALYRLARVQVPVSLALAFVVAFTGTMMLRDGATLGSLPAASFVCLVPWAFGYIVTCRQNAAHRSADMAERLGAIDVARVAHGAAAQERRRVIDESIATLRAALDQIRMRATAASKHATDARIGSIQDAARTAIDRLHATLGALRGTTHTQRRVLPVVQRRRSLTPAAILRLQVVAAVLTSALMLVGPSLMGSDWQRPVTLVPALLVPAAALIAPRLPITAGLLAACALIVAKLDTPHPPEVLVPIGLPLAALCWRLGQAESPQRWWAIGAVGLASVWLGAEHGHEGVGYVLLLLTLGIFGGLAWAHQDETQHREEARAAKYTAQLAEAEIGAIREERRRIARELHDVVSHAVASVSLQAQVARIHLDAKPQESNAALGNVLDIAGSTALELESIADRLQRGELKLDLQHLVDGACNLGLTIRAGLDDNALDDELAYRIVQEGLTNAARYAPGSTVEIAVRTRDTRRHVTVRNGVAGTDTTVVAHVGSGSGLAGLTERVQDARGNISFGDVDEGFEIRADWPLKWDAAGDGFEVLDREPLREESA